MPPIWRTRASTPEQALAAAILTQAFTDMFPVGNRDDGRVDTDAVHAMRYLTDRYGHSAYWRNKWCSYLDLDGDLLATRVRMILDGVVDPPADMRFTQRLDHARARWASLPHKPAPQPKPKSLLNGSPPSAPPPLPRIVPKVDPREVAKAATKAQVYAHLHQPIRQVDIVNALVDDICSSRVIAILKEGIECGEVVRNQDRRYRLAV